MKALLILTALLWSQFSQAQSTCTPYSSIIYGGGIYATGSATVSNDTNNLIINLTSDSANGWLLERISVYAGPGPIPQNGGVPDPVFFPYQEYFANGNPIQQFTIPLADLSTACNGNSIQVSIFVVMRRIDSNGNIIQYENAWAFGPNQFSGTNLAWWFDYTPCCQSVVETGCTHSHGYYKNNSVYTKKTPQPWPISENSLLCGKKWYDVIKVTPKLGDAWTILAQQWIASMLNVATGASTGAIVDIALSDSQTMLANNCSVLPKGAIERQIALEYKLLLENYNKGLTGPGMCANE